MQSSDPKIELKTATKALPIEDSSKQFSKTDSLETPVSTNGEINETDDPAKVRMETPNDPVLKSIVNVIIAASIIMSAYSHCPI